MLPTALLSRAGFVETPGHLSILDVRNERRLEDISTAPADSVSSARDFAAVLLGGASHRVLKGGGGGGGGGDGFDTGVFCDPRGHRCEEELGDGYFCAYFDDNPNAGALSFDSVPFTALVILQSITFDAWTTPMFALMSVVSPLSFLFSVSTFDLSLLALGPSARASVPSSNLSQLFEDASSLLSAILHAHSCSLL